MKHTKTGAVLTLEEIDTIGEVLQIAMDNLRVNPDKAEEGLLRIQGCLFAMLPDYIREV